MVGDVEVEEIRGMIGEEGGVRELVICSVYCLGYFLVRVLGDIGV